MTGASERWWPTRRCARHSGARPAQAGVLGVAGDVLDHDPYGVIRRSPADEERRPRDPVEQAEPDDPLRRSFAGGLSDLIDALRRLDGADEEDVMVELSTIVGAMMLSRACAGDDLSDRVLTAVRDHLLDGPRQ
ncbi:hypothetical protein FE391_18150 [Nonomuraea sp. KC401]|uniref:hypothetical protein n=1 Tax=unclassified Nonomuraea TaxID=2593643 RepID=UPI0010FDA515|nr:MULTISPECIES: hypothetical protein [unclassified Nonomuraea]NBE95651.1 hypothetical protein [Nonomuraea sp. K271]TLF71882.1 hypothetical protein FE391_18150 [Nonomuraea sp. KC401]